jgi:hypothetical protein
VHRTNINEQVSNSNMIQNTHIDSEYTNYTLNVHAVTTKLHLFTVTLDVHQIQVKLLVNTFYYYNSMTIFKGRKVALSCAQGIVHIKVI